MIIAVTGIRVENKRQMSEVFLLFFSLPGMNMKGVIEFAAPLFWSHYFGKKALGAWLLSTRLDHILERKQNKNKTIRKLRTFVPTSTSICFLEN